MKKIISFLLCLVFVLSLTACGRTMNGADTARLLRVFLTDTSNKRKTA